MPVNLLSEYFNFDSLAIIMIILVIFIGSIVGKFAINYMKGDNKYLRFFISLFSLMASVIIMFGADNIFIFITFWAISNYILVKMMIHKKSWNAAKESGYLAARMYLIGFFSMLLAFIILYIKTGESSIKAIINQNNESPIIIMALILILISAMIQSAIWPFSRWLVSSLNSPLPVSAIMHAGLVNGGGFLMVRFSPLYSNNTIILDLIFIIGLVTAITGTLWKLMQSDIKRMLACSTMAQMGFMIVQIGLGLFSAAIAHIILHSIFKSYLFLSSSSAAQERKSELHYPPTIISLTYSLLCGALGSYIFASINNNTWITKDTNLVLTSVAFIACSQLALSILRQNSLIKFIFAFLATMILGAVYGFNVEIIESILSPLSLWSPQQLNIIHVTGLALLVLFWLGIIFAKYLQDYIPLNIKIWLYVKTLNASQPYLKTITTYRNYYQY